MNHSSLLFNYSSPSTIIITTGDEDCGLTNSTMSTAHLGTLNPTDEPITSTLEHVQLSLLQIQLAMANKCLSIVGPATYAILRDLFAPALPNSVTLADIFERLKKHYERATIVERYHFHKRDQLEGETATQYDAALRKLATHCRFADYLEEALRDQFVYGLRDGTELFNDDCSQRRNSHSQKLVPGLVVRLTVIKAKTRPGIEARRYEVYFLVFRFIFYSAEVPYPRIFSN